MMNKLMKKAMIVLAAATMAISSMGVATFANDGTNIIEFSVSEASGNRTVIVDSASVREQPTTKANCMFNLPYGSVVAIDGVTNNGWVRITCTNPKWGGQCAGYIRADLLSNNNSGRTNQQDEHLEHELDCTVKVDRGYLALRNAPATNPANEIGQLHTGDTFHVTDKLSNGFWFGTTANGVSGFVNSNYLTY